MIDRDGQPELSREELPVVVDERHEADVGSEQPGGQACQPIHRRVGGVAESGEGDRPQPANLLVDLGVRLRAVRLRGDVAGPGRTGVERAHRAWALLGVVWNVMAMRFHMLIMAMAPTR